MIVSCHESFQKHKYTHLTFGQKVTKNKFFKSNIHFSNNKWEPVNESLGTFEQHCVLHR